MALIEGTTLQNGAIAKPKFAGVTNTLPTATAVEKAADQSGGGSGSGSTGGTGFDPTAFANDWYKAYFQQYGLPGDVQNEVVKILTQYASDPTTAAALAQQYLRSTQWFQNTYPGFNQGVSQGLFTDETGYRSYLGNVNQLFNEYLGRHVTGDELSSYLASGYSPSYVGNLLQGQAWVNANRADVQRLAGSFGDTGPLTDAQLTALGNEKAGIDTAQGQSLDNILSKAQQRMSTLFGGKLATGSLTLGANGLQLPSLLGTKQKPDVQA